MLRVGKDVSILVVGAGVDDEKRGLFVPALRDDLDVSSDAVRLEDDDGFGEFEDEEDEDLDEDLDDDFDDDLEDDFDEDEEFEEDEEEDEDGDDDDDFGDGDY